MLGKTEYLGKKRSTTERVCNITKVVLKVVDFFVKRSKNMSKFRVEKNKDYTIMSNYHFKEKKMSLKAKGLLSLMLSLPDNWDYTISGLVAICKENETSIKSALEELKNFGYLEVVKFLPNQTESGRIEYQYNIYEIPKQEGEKQGVENLGVEFLGVENQGQLNTNKSIKKELNTNIIDIVSYLNEKTEKHFKNDKPNTVKLINARLSEGYSIDDFKNVIDRKCKEWKGDYKMDKYLAPDTLFNATNFEKYVNERNITKQVGEVRTREYSHEEMQGFFTDLESVKFE